MATARTGSSSDPVPTDPKGPPPRVSAAGLDAQGAAKEAVESSRKAAIDAAAQAEAARIEQAAKQEAAHKANEAAKLAKDKQEDLARLTAARQHLRHASPDEPIPLRRVEVMSSVGDTLYGTSKTVIDKRNSEFAGVTLLFDGQVVHVINDRDPARSFWIGYANIAAMYPRLDA